MTTEYRKPTCRRCPCGGEASESVSLECDGRVLFRWRCGSGCGMQTEWIEGSLQQAAQVWNAMVGDARAAGGGVSRYHQNPQDSTGNLADGG